MGQTFGFKLPAAEEKAVSSAKYGASILIVLDLIRQTLDLSGDVAECGVFRGHTLIPMAIYLKQKAPGKRIFALDSFSGFDESVEKDIEFGGAYSGMKQVGGFSGTSDKLVQDKLRRTGTYDLVELVVGYFNRTLPVLSGKKFSFVHLDCDLYESYRICLDFFYPRMVRGGIILIDEYHEPIWPGCTKAVDQFLEDKAERPIPIERGCFSKFYIQKL